MLWILMTDFLNFYFEVPSIYIKTWKLYKDLVNIFHLVLPSGDIFELFENKFKTWRSTTS